MDVDRLMVGLNARGDAVFDDHPHEVRTSDAIVTECRNGRPHGRIAVFVEAHFVPRRHCARTAKITHGSP
jgi:hypothetical protein